MYKRSTYRYKFSTIEKSKQKMTTPELIATLDCLLSILVKACYSRINFDDDNLDDEDYVNLTGITREQFDNLMSQIKSLRKKKIFAPKLHRNFVYKIANRCINSYLETMFKFKRSIHICHIISKARKAIIKDFVPILLGSTIFLEMTSKVVIRRYLHETF